MDNLLEQLKRPFEAKDIEWRVQQSGDSNSGKPWAMVLAYVTNRAIMDRLDEVFGLGRWKNDFSSTPNNDGVLCGISCKIDNEWITKYDGASNTDIEAVKGGISSAMKRTGVQWGIGRYLYHLEAGFATIVEKGVNGAKFGKTKKNTEFYWVPPQLPPFALPILKEQIKVITEEAKIKGVSIDDILKGYKISNLKYATQELGTKIIKALAKKPTKEKKDATTSKTN